MSIDLIALGRSLLGWIERTPLSGVIRHSDWAVMGLESLHLLGLALVGGVASVLAIAASRRDGLRGLSVADLARGALPLQAAGFALMAASGALIAWSMPHKYYLNAAFRLKMALLLAAIAVTAWLWRSARRRGSAIARRAAALLAFLLWLAVGLSGRWVGFL